MSDPRLPLTALRAFEASARLLSFKHAAAELHVTPTAISHQIQQLEKQLGVELFIRVHRGLELTTAAQSCLPHVQEGFTALQTAIEVVQQHKDTGLLSVSAPPSFVMRLLMPLTHDFLAAHPKIDLRITTRMRDPLLVAAKRQQNETDTFRQWTQESDIVIVFGRDGFGDLEVEQLMPLSIDLVCSPRLLQSGSLNQIHDVMRFPWIHDDRGLKYGGVPFWTKWLAHAGLEPKVHDQGGHYTHAALAIDAAVRGDGLLVTTPCLCQKELRNGSLVAPFKLSVEIDNSYFLLNRPTRRPAVTQFKQWLRPVLRGMNTA